MQSSRYICRACLLSIRSARRSALPKNSQVSHSNLSTSSISRNAIILTRPMVRETIRSTQLNRQGPLLYSTSHQLQQLSNTTTTITLSHTRTRPFSSTANPSQRATVNPRKDEDGKEMEIEITPRASKRLLQIMHNDANPALALRVQVESGGCHGFQYLMSLTSTSEVSGADDTVFESDEGARVVMDEPSLELLKGSKVDYTTELIGSQFKIADNPLATSSCGCGTSFDIKD